jgi:hypothetical protein
VLSWVLFFVFYQYLFAKRIFQFDLGSLHYIISAYTLSSMLCFVTAFLIGFLPLYFVHLTQMWRLKKRIMTLEANQRGSALPPPPPASPPPAYAAVDMI